tara:strand:+ start:688 stop:1206 length:519 start_codon:yes stop_codon:yes gene_type:complete
MGYWRDLMFEHTISTTNDYFALPYEAESVVSAVVDGFPVDMNARWQDYRTNGRFVNSPDEIYGIVDDGLHSTKVDLNESKRYNIEARPVSPNNLLPSSGSIFVVYVNKNGGKIEHEIVMNGLGSAGTSLGYNLGAVSVDSIRFDGVTDFVEVVAVEISIESSSSSSSSSSSP